MNLAAIVTPPLLLAALIAPVNAQFNKCAPGFCNKTGAFTWTERVIAGMHSWLSIDISSDATKLVVVDNGGDLWTSANSGASWTDRSAAGTRSWQFAAISSDGSIIAASYTEAMSRGVVVSVDSGSNWNDRAVAGSVGLTWFTMAGDGAKMAVADPTGAGSGGAVYLSSNSGTTWAASAGAGTHVWTGIKYSRDGSTIVAITTNLVLLTTNGGGTWTDITPTTGAWDGLGVSSDGSHIAVSKDAGVWYSTNSGASFTELPSTTAFAVYGVALSDAGTTLLVVTDAAGNIQRSTDSGGSWTTQSPPGIANWIAPALSADGLKSVAATLDGNIWTGQ